MLRDYWLKRPSYGTSGPTAEAAEAFLVLADAAEGLVDVDAFLCRRPHVVRWQFLCDLAARRRIAFHARRSRGSA